MNRQLFTEITSFFQEFNALLSVPQRENFLLYVLGLMLPCNKTVNGITEEMRLKKNQSSLNRFLTESKWKVAEIYSALLDFVKPHLKGTVYLIVDDTLCEKTGRKIKGVARHFDHNEKRTVLSHSIVAGILKCADVILPYGMRLYRKMETCKGVKFRTKIELAKNMINEFLSLDFQKKIILFDAFYAASDILLSIGGSAGWVSRCKKNRLVEEQGFHYSLEELSGCIAPGQYTEVKIGRKKYFVCEYLANLKGVGQVLIVFSKKKRHSQKVSYFITNMVELGGREVLLHYSERWSIEVFFRDVKQNLGMGKCQLRALRGIIRHWCLVSVAYGLLSRLLSSLKGTCATIGKMCRVVRLNLPGVLSRVGVT